MERNRVVSVIPVSEEDCKRLHDNSADECIESRKLGNPQCEPNKGAYSGGSVSEMSDFTVLSHHPGFRGVSFG